MGISRWSAIALTGACLCCVGIPGAAATSTTPEPAADAKLLAHGKYLVTQAIPCYECHTPRDRQGRLIEAHALQGALIGFKPIHPVAGWKPVAPAIAGLPSGWSFEQTVHFLETGLTPGGDHAGPPMQPFRFNAWDARAIATYLQSLPKPAAPSTHKH